MLSSAKTILEQQKFFYSLYGYQDKILWDIYEPNQKTYLIKKVESLMGKINEDQKNTLIDAIWKQKKYTNGTLFLSVFYVMCTAIPDSSSTRYSMHIVFRVKKCSDESNSKDCCMIYIDETGRVYHTWDYFTNTNILPNKYAYAPEYGIYNFNWIGIQLECFVTPLSSGKQTTLRLVDTGTTGAGLAATGIAIAAAIPAVTVAPILLTGSAIAGIACGIYGVVRSSARLVNKSKHEEDISLFNSDSRGCWLGIIGGVLGLGAGAATKCISKVAAEGGKVSNAVQNTVNSLNVASLASNGICIANGGVILYQKEGKMTTMDWIQLSSSLFLFTHSTFNFQLAATIVDNSQNQTMQQYRNDLSKNQKRMFDKMAKETVRVSGDRNTAKQDIIRGLKNIPDTKTHFRDVYKINKQLNKNNIKISFGSDGKTLLNSKVEFKASELRANIKQATKQILKNNPATVPTVSKSVFGNVPKFDGKNYVPAKINYDIVSNTFSSSIIQKLQEVIVTTSKQYFVENQRNFMHFLKYLVVNFIEEIINQIIELTELFIDKFNDYLQSKLKRKIPFEEYLINIFNTLVKLADEKINEIATILKRKIHELFDDVSQIVCEHYDLEVPSTNNNSFIDEDNRIRNMFQGETSGINTIFNLDQLILYTIQLSEHLTIEQIQRTIRLVKTFNAKYGDCVSKDLKRFISFDDNYIDMINLIFELSNSSFNQFASTLDSLSPATNTLIFDKLLKFYKSKNTYSNPNTKCKVCRGKYYTL